MPPAVIHYFDYRSPYAYMHCRREARRRNLVIRGPRKIFDSSVAHIGFLYARGLASFRPYHDAVYERFWRRELDIENPEAVARQLEAAGIDASGFAAYLAGEGRREMEAIQRDAEDRGVFGVPSYRLGDELFFGNERIGHVRERLEASDG